MRTSAICPTCATYENALCIIYNGGILSTINVAPLDSLEEALVSINASVSNLTSYVNSNLTSIGGSITTINNEISDINDAIENIDLQTVTDVGSTTTNGITANSFTTANTVTAGDVVIGDNVNDGTISPDNLTAQREYQLPDEDGTFVLSVNGNTADAAGNVTISTGLPYSSYVAIVAFTGGTPSETIVKNDFTGVTFSYSLTNPSTGNYILTVTPSVGTTFTINKTVAFTNSYNSESIVSASRVGSPSSGTVRFNFKKLDGISSFSNGDMFIEIRVYP
jgi:hypothetical protein